MELITKEILETLPPIYGTEKTATDWKEIKLKLFCPWSTFRWYIVEYDPETDEAFGFTTSHLCPEGELGYINVAELRTLKGPFGLKIERDIHWDNTTIIQDVKNKSTF